MRYLTVFPVFAAVPLPHPLHSRSLIAMQEHCHRCGGALVSGPDITPFCPHCGAPQLFLQEYDRTDSDSEGAPLDSTGTPPPPAPPLVDWQAAIRCALLVAGIAAVLSLIATRVPFVSPFSSLTILSASILTMGLYQRRRPRARMDAAVGARIGLITGLSLVVCLTVAMAIAGLIARFGLHTMGAFDAELTQQLHLQIDRAAAANPVPPDTLHYFYSPEFRAGMMLTGVAMFSFVLLFFSTVGGALSGLLRTRRVVTPVA